MCGLSTVVTPAGASLTVYREIRSYANSIWDDNNNNILGTLNILYFLYKRTPNVVMTANLFQHDRNPTVELK